MYSNVVHRTWWVVLENTKTLKQLFVQKLQISCTKCFIMVATLGRRKPFDTLRKHTNRFTLSPFTIENFILISLHLFPTPSRQPTNVVPWLQNPSHKFPPFLLYVYFTSTAAPSSFLVRHSGNLDSADIPSVSIHFWSHPATIINSPIYPFFVSCTYPTNNISCATQYKIETLAGIKFATLASIKSNRKNSTTHTFTMSAYPSPISPFQDPPITASRQLPTEGSQDDMLDDGHNLHVDRIPTTELNGGGYLINAPLHTTKTNHGNGFGRKLHAPWATPSIRRTIQNKATKITRGSYFSQKETDKMLDAIEAYLPICKEEWDVVLSEHTYIWWLWPNTSQP